MLSLCFISQKILFFVGASDPLLTVPELELGNLNELAEKCVSASEPLIKGRLLETFLESVVHLDRDFDIVNKHVRTETGEIDYVLKHSISTGLWAMSPYIAVECKNWKDPIEPAQLHHFLQLVRDNGPLCAIGLYVTVSRLTDGSWTAIRDARLRDKIITIVVEAENFRKLADGLRGLVPQLYEKQTFGAK